MSNTGIDIARLRAVAETLAADGADYVRRRRPEVFGIGEATAAVATKSTRTDPVTIVDTETEALLRERLARLRPGDAILGEEGGATAGVHGDGGDAVTWVIDPIDGTVNFLYDVPAYAVSVAATVAGESVAGAVADVAGRRLYSAGAGLGAQVRSGEQVRPLQCSAAAELALALCGTGFGYSPARRAVQAALLAQLLPVVRDVRRIGSAALDLCMVAAGRLDVYYEHGTKPWDYAAGALIAAEAGALIRLPEPDDDQDAGGLIVAAAPGVAEEFLALLHRIGATAPIPR